MSTPSLAKKLRIKDLPSKSGVQRRRCGMGPQAGEVRTGMAGPSLRYEGLTKQIVRKKAPPGQIAQPISTPISL